MATVQRPIPIPEPTNKVDSLWKTAQALKEAVEVIQGIRGNREYALLSDLESALAVINNITGGSVPGITNLYDLNDTDLTGQATGDLLYNFDGANWRDTAGQIVWTESALQLANDLAINWLNAAGASIELLTLKPAVTIPADNVWANVVLLADFEGTDGATTYSEVSNNAGAANFFGTAALSNERSHFGLTSLKLDGNSDYVSFPWISNNLFCPQVTPGNHNYTIDIWFYSTADTIVTEQFLCGATENLFSSGWNLTLNPNRTIKFRSNKNGSNNYTVNGTIVCAVNRWHHIGYTYEEITAGNAQNALYVNGVNDLSFANGFSTYDNGGDFYIGLGGVGSGYFQGYIDGVRLTQYVTRYPAITPVDFAVATESWPLSVDTLETDPTSGGFFIGDAGYSTSIDGLEVNIISASTNVSGDLDVSGDLNIQNATIDSALSINGVASFQDDVILSTTSAVNIDNYEMVAFTPEILLNWDSVSLQANFDGPDAATTYTSEDNGFRAATFIGDAQLDTAQFKFGTASLLCDGTGDYITFPSSVDWDFGGDDFTVECWVRHNASTGTQCYTSLYNSEGVNERSWIFRWDSAVSGRLQFTWSTDGINTTILSSTTAWIPTVGVWYHVAVCRSGNTLYMYADGVQIYNAAFSITLFPTTEPLWVGSAHGVAGATNLLNGWIDDVRITKGVGRYTTAFTPPVAAHPAAVDTFILGSPNANTVIDGVTTEVSQVFRVSDAARTDYADFSHDGTDFDVAFTATVDWNITGQTGRVFIDSNLATSGTFTITGTTISSSAAPAFVFNETDASADEKNWQFVANGSSFELVTINDIFTATETVFSVSRTGTSVDRIDIPQLVRISDSAATDWAEFSHDGTNFDIDFTGTTSVILTGQSDFSLIGGDSKLWGGGTFMIYDTSNSDKAEFSHDGTDFNTAFTTTADWNITGLTGGTLDLDGSLTVGEKINVGVITVVATTYTAADEHVILVDDDTAAATVTVTLPTAATANTIYHVKKLGTTANVIVDGDGSETIDGATTVTLTTQYESIMVVSNGSSWSVI